MSQGAKKENSLKKLSCYYNLQAEHKLDMVEMPPITLCLQKLYLGEENSRLGVETYLHDLNFYSETRTQDIDSLKRLD